MVDALSVYNNSPVKEISLLNFLVATKINEFRKTFMDASSLLKTIREQSNHLAEISPQIQ